MKLSVPRFFAVFSVAAAVASSTGCKQDDLVEPFEVDCPSRAVFSEHVSKLMEQRCGTLDCHGSIYRPMRLYGRDGLRHPAEANRTGEAVTTDLEMADNYYSVCAIEPEKMAKLVADPGGNAVNTLLLVRKARGQEAHKGGRVFDPWDDADRCVVGWLRGDPESSIEKACKAALSRLP